MSINQIVLSQDVTNCGYDICITQDNKIRTIKNYSESDKIIGQYDYHAGELMDIFPIFGQELEHPMSKPLYESYHSIYGEKIDWLRALGKSKFVSSIADYFRDTKSTFEELDEKNYVDTIIEGRKILRELHKANVDFEELEKELKVKNTSNLTSLLSDTAGICDVVRYSHESQTGRMTVKSGPRVLLLSKEDRRFFVPGRHGNVLAQVDFVSLEPRVTYLLTHESSPRDIYEEMGKTVGGDVSRAKLKIATISSLYGSSHVDSKISKKIQEFFAINKITREHLNEERLFNLYGRPLNPEDNRLRLSHFVQSTAVDVALLGFSKFIEGKDLIPYFMIHDSLVFECDKNSYEELKNQQLYVDVEPLGRFYLELSKFGKDI
jgi:hypothetical protein